MKTKLFNLLSKKLYRSRQCKYCIDSMNDIYDSIVSGKIVRLNFTPDVNSSGIVTHYHINFLGFEVNHDVKKY